MSGEIFRADTVGSLIRPKPLLAIRETYDGPGRGPVPDTPKPPSLVAAEDEAIRNVVAFQEAAGLKVVTDGEFRRGSYFADFLKRLGGLRIVMDTEGFAFVDGTPTATIAVEDKVVWPEGGITVGDYRFLASAAHVTAKVSIPSPTHALFFESGERIKPGVYADMDAFYDAMVAAYRKEIAALAEAGCAYVQFDDTTFVKLCDPKFVDRLKEKGGDPGKQLTLWIDVLNRAIAERPKGMIAAVHMCRGNGPRGAWISQGGYDAIAEELFGTLEFDRLLLEYDSDRAGGFAPLRHVPKGRVAVLGLVTTKSPELEPADVLKRRIDEASAHIALDQLALGPQCGFASGKAGYPMTEAEEDRKLRRIVEVATEVWGAA